LVVLILSYRLPATGYRLDLTASVEAKAMGESLAAIGPAVANHLWQSTAFAAVAWAVVLLLRRNQARVRYAVWLAASAKFLVPFALLISLGGMLPRPRHTVVAMPVYSAVDEVGLPFSDVETVPVAAADPTHAAIQPRHEWGTQLWPVVLVGVWLCGVVTVLAVWWVRWRQVAGTLRRAEAAATRQERGARETEVLRQVQRTMGVRVRLVLSGELMEPGVFGVVRPVLIWPERLSERLDDEHIEAILAHELMHVRRRDNLTAVLHMFVEAAFWFHPAVWWLGAHLVEERERACDEAVVEMGSRPGVYAEGLLKAVRFCVESPLACVAGVTGADLSRRVRSIMTLRLERLGWGRKLVLLLVALTMVAVPVLLGQGKAAQRMMLAAVNAAPKPVRTWAAAHAMIAVEETPSTGLIAEVQADGAVGQGSGIREQGTGNAAASPDDDALGPAFEVAAIHPANRDDGRHWFGLRLDASGGFTTSSMSLSGLVRTAYVQQPGEGNVSGGPKWAQSDTFDINAKVDDAYMAGWDKLSYGQRLDRVRPMIRRLLADRFQLKLRVEMQPTPVYALVQAKGGARMKEVPAPDPVEGDPMEAQTKWMRDNPEKPMPGSVTCSGHTCTGVAVPMKSAIGQISGSSHADRMVIDQTGLKGYYTFTFTQPRPNDDSAMAEIEDDLGLKFEPRTVPMKTYIIDSAEKPSVDGAEVQAPGDQKQALHGAYKVWLEQDVRWVITDQEAQAFQRLTNDEERDKFIEQFWQRRNPAPDAADNAYRDEIYARIAYANEHFAADQPGWMTDRGHVYIAYGKPDEIDMQPADGTQIWRYRHLPGVGDNIVLKFGDGERKGDYRLMTPMPQTGAGAQTPNPLKRRLTDAERLGGVVQADPPKQRLVGP
jgi:uncharacterized protein (TIGR03435 family)